MEVLPDPTSTGASGGRCAVCTHPWYCAGYPCTGNSSVKLVIVIVIVMVALVLIPALIIILHLIVPVSITVRNSGFSSCSGLSISNFGLSCCSSGS